MLIYAASVGSAFATPGGKAPGYQELPEKALEPLEKVLGPSRESFLESPREGRKPDLKMLMLHIALPIPATDLSLRCRDDTTY